MNRRTATLMFVAAVCNGALSAQQPQVPAEPSPVTFRVEVNYIEVDAFVTDAQGKVVSDLRVEDFDVLEDGKPQKVSAFSLVNIPIERAVRPLFAARPVEADVQTNENIDGRLYLIVLDDLHTDFTRTPRVKTALRRFLEQNFGTNDLAAVVFTGRAEDSQDFTNNSRLLLAAVDKFSGRKLTSATMERIQGARVNPETGNFGPGDDTSQMERAFRARSVMASIRKLSEFMAGVHGRRKAVLLVGEGVDYDIFEAVGPGGATATSVIQDTHDAIAAATRGNVSIYAIDPRGLTTGDEDLIGVSSTFPDQGAGLRSMQNELRLSQDSLRVLAANTGGFAAVNQNDLNGAFDRIVAENSTYYVLGFYSTNERRDGRYRKIEVRMSRPGLRVRSRNGYYEARGRKPAPPAAPSPNAMTPAIAEALGSPLPMGGVPMKVFAAPYKGVAPDAAVAIVVEIDVSKFNFVEKGGTFNEQLEVAHSATDSKGKVFPGDRHNLTLAMKPDSYERMKKRGLRVLTQFNLPPGRYQLRVAAGNKTGTAAGSVLYDLDVPDFYKAPFAMSGVTLTSAAALEAPTIKAKDPLGDFLPSPPTTVREFDTNDILVLFAEIYENAREGPTHVIDLRAELRGEDGKVIRESSEERSSTELRGTSGGGYGFTARLPLNDLSPGLYVLHVGGQSRAGDKPSASRDIQIRIR